MFEAVLVLYSWNVLFMLGLCLEDFQYGQVVCSSEVGEMILSKCDKSKDINVCKVQTMPVK